MWTDEDHYEAHYGAAREYYERPEEECTVNDPSDDARLFMLTCSDNDRHPEIQRAIRDAERVFAAVPTVRSRDGLRVIAGAIMTAIIRTERDAEAKIMAARKAERETYALEIKMALDAIAARGPSR